MRPNWETLNAYVDNELSVADAAVVARALASDRELAQKVAALSQLKAAVPGCFEAADITLPAQPYRKWRAMGPLAIAASIVLLLAVGAVTAMGLQNFTGNPAQSAWLTQALQRHQSWADGPANEGADKSQSGVVLATFSALGPDALLPDLTATGLTINKVTPVSLPALGGSGLHVGYTGTRGCRLSLLIAPASEIFTKVLVRHDSSAAQLYTWRAGALSYLLMAEGMDPTRLALIAETVHRATIERSQFTAEMRTALQENRARSQACAA